MIFNIFKNKLISENEISLQNEYLKVKKNDNIYGFQKNSINNQIDYLKYLAKLEINYLIALE